MWERITPVAQLFIIALALLWVGAAIPGLAMMAKVGAFIVFVYLVVWIVWFFNR